MILDYYVVMADLNKLAKKIDQEIRRLKVKNTANLRAIRKEYSKKLKEITPKEMLALARILMKRYKHRFVALEMIRNHPGTLESLKDKEIVALAGKLNSWWTVDGFAGMIAGPAWQRGLLSDNLIHEWARSNDLWWRRLALVCTVGLNARSWGGTGDVKRTLKVCRMLAGDHEDMVVKAMSWALRALIAVDRKAVIKFLKDYDDIIAARVKREVNNKLTTGLKYPRKKR